MTLVPPARAERVALAVLSLGALAVVLAALPYNAFELDRFFVPKELVLHVTAAVTALLCLRELGWVVPTRVDVCLAGYLVLGLASALAADNWWLAGRALGISAAGVALFWVARALAHGSLARPLLTALAVAVVAAAVTALLQAYGVGSAYVSLNRAPGGTFGNRNFVAHLAAVGAPVLLLRALQARRALGAALGAIGVAAVSATLVLSRSRAAWVALIAAGVLVALALWKARGGRRGARWPAPPRLRRRVAVLAVAGAAAVVTAMLVPNSLRWKSDSPYLDSVLGVVNYREGSGQGRLVQYRNTLRMAAAHPLLGVGPGNWPVDYPRFASRDDPSLGTDGMTANPWPSSDWMAILAERGGPAFLLLTVALLGLAANAWVQLREARTPDDALPPLALGATVAITVAVGAFDAVLLLPAPTLIVWPVLGALSRPRTRRSSVAVPDPLRGRAAALVVVLGALLVARSASQIAAMAAYSDTTRLRRIEHASRLDPGSYRIQMRLAGAYATRGACGRARPHASRARALYPSAPEPKRLLRACRAATSAARD